MGCKKRSFLAAQMFLFFAVIENFECIWYNIISLKDRGKKSDLQNRFQRY